MDENPTQTTIIPVIATEEAEQPTPTIQELVGKAVTINGREFNFDPKRLKWGKFCDLQAELKSGMVAKYYKDTEESEMTFTKEYALKQGLVTNELMRILFALDIQINDLTPDDVEPMLKIVKQSGFMERLEPKEEKKSKR
jgi:hypothetical protein